MKTVIVCIAKSEDYYFEEWVDYHKKLGFDEIYVYCNDWECKLERDFITKIPFPGKHMQIPSYRDFLTKYRNNFDWAAFIDCDEFILLKKHKTIKEFLIEFDNPYGIGVNWVFYGGDGKEKRNGNSLLKQFTKRQNGVDRHIKTILKLNSGGNMSSPHNPNINLMDTNRNFFKGPYNPKGDENYIVLNHYHHKTFEDWLIRCERGQSDHSRTRTPQDWIDTEKDFCDFDDYDAINFMYNN